MLLGHRNFFEVDGLPYCEKDWIVLYGDKCFYCKIPLTGEKVSFLGKHFHPYHFYCSMCECVCEAGQFTQWDGKALCKTCFYKLPEAVRDRVKQRTKAERSALAGRQKEEDAVAKASTTVKTERSGKAHKKSHKKK